VSVVLTTFNRSALVGRAIESVLGQTLEDFELIVVDDGSTDDTAQVVARIDDPRVSLVRHEHNLGLAEARNSGIRQARGRFVCFLDDDDELLPDKLSAQTRAFENEHDPNKVLLYCQAIVDDGISTDVRPTRGMRHGEPLCEYLMCGEGAMPIHAVMVTRELIAETMFAPKQRRFEDYSWLLRLEGQGVRFVLIDRPLVVWHVQMRRARLSRVVSFEHADEWLDSCGAAITPKARKAFLARETAPFVDHRRNRLRIVRTIATAVASGSISVAEGVKSILKAFLPTGALYRLRHLLPRSRFG
jgi:glycosyltransferase involved in cell wall biosynthesis